MEEMNFESPSGKRSFYVDDHVVDVDTSEQGVIFKTQLEYPQRSGIRAEIKPIDKEFQIMIYDGESDFAFFWGDEIKFDGFSIVVKKQGDYVGRVALKWFTNN